MRTIYLYSGLPQRDKERQKVALEKFGMAVRVLDSNVSGKLYPEICHNSVIVFDTTFCSHAVYYNVRKYVKNKKAIFIQARLTPGRIETVVREQLKQLGITIS
jgi:hypothetical protein